MVFSIFRRSFNGRWVFVHSFSSLAYCKKYCSKHFPGCDVRITRHLPFDDPIKIYDFSVLESGSVIDCHYYGY